MTAQALLARFTTTQTDMRLALSIILALCATTCREEAGRRQTYPEEGGLIFAPTAENDCLASGQSLPSEVAKILVNVVVEGSDSVVRTYELSPSQASLFIGDGIPPGRYVLKAVACGKKKALFKGESEPFSVEAGVISAPLVYMTRVDAPSCVGQANSHPLVKANRFMEDGRLAFASLCALDESHVVMAGGVHRVTRVPKGLALEASDGLFVLSLRSGVFETLKDAEGYVLGLSEPRAMHRCALVDRDRVAFFGGAKKATLALRRDASVGDIFEDVLPPEHLIEVFPLSGGSSEFVETSVQSALPASDVREDIGMVVLAGGIDADKKISKRIVFWDYKKGNVTGGDLKIPRYGGNLLILSTGQVLVFGGATGSDVQGVELAWTEDGTVTSVAMTQIALPVGFATSLVLKDDQREAVVFVVAGVREVQGGFASSAEPITKLLRVKGDGDKYTLEGAEVQDIVWDSAPDGLVLPPLPTFIGSSDNGFLLNALIDYDETGKISCAEHLDKNSCYSAIIALALDLERAKLSRSALFYDYHLRIGASSLAMKDSFAMVFGGIALDNGVESPTLLSTGFLYPVAQAENNVSCGE
jgi:hypothetical protein